MKNTKRKNWKGDLLFLLLDALSIFTAIVCATLLCEGQFQFQIEYLYWFLLNVAVIPLSFLLFGVYGIIVQTIGIIDAVKITASIAVGFLFNFIFHFLIPSVSIPMVVAFLLFLLIFTGGTRFAYRLVHSAKYAFHAKNKKGVPALIVGAGSAGAGLLREIHNSNKIVYRPVCIVDDDEKKLGGKLGEVKIAGTTKDIPALCKQYGAEEILIAIPSAPKAEIRRILEICRETGCKVKTVPGIYQFVKGEITIGALRDVQITDLLGRDQVKINAEDIFGYIEGETVLVTGGGGSIGSELCRQIAAHNPKQLIILDIYENNAYGIEQELKRKFPELPLLTLIASVRDKGKIEDVFEKYRPTIVFNAAAHKHVPLMETSPNEAVKNNVFGTLNVARSADKYGVKTFVQISTDKAVNPTNVMGATKRVCEMIIQTIGKHSKTNFVAVRFGNVLGSNGSVIPLFKQQIAEGGPVTVTHKDIIRYFMTISEAVSLVLQAGAYAKGGQIFVLDMGEPVKIYDLAYNLIKLSGLEPNVDIEIKCTGLRPGEKLYEERLMDEEGLQKTPNGLISIANPIEIDEKKLWDMLESLYKAAYAETNEMKRLVAELVPTYHPNGEKI